MPRILRRAIPSRRAPFHDHLPVEGVERVRLAIGRPHLHQRTIEAGVVNIHQGDCEGETIERTSYCQSSDFSQGSAIHRVAKIDCPSADHASLL